MPEIYGLRYAEFVVPLVKAVQELSEQNEAKDAAIASLQAQVNELTHVVNELNKAK
jgi:prefoldin subunit 5